MSSFFDDLMVGLNEAVAIEKGELTGKRKVYEIQPVKKYDNVQIKRIRLSVGMTQGVFADCMGVSPKTVEAWEKGTNRPTGTACRLMSMLEKKTLKHYPL